MVSNLRLRIANAGVLSLQVRTSRNPYSPGTLNAEFESPTIAFSLFAYLCACHTPAEKNIDGDPEMRSHFQLEAPSSYANCGNEFAAKAGNSNCKNYNVTAESDSGEGLKVNPFGGPESTVRSCLEFCAVCLQRGFDVLQLLSALVIENLRRDASCLVYVGPVRSYYWC